MQTTVTTPQRRSRRNTRHQNVKDLSQVMDLQKGAEVPNAQNRIPDQSISNVSQQITGPLEPCQNYPDMGNTPTTPPRPRSMYDSPSIYEAAFKGQHSGNVSAVEGNGQRNKQAQKAQNRQSGSYTNPKTNGTPQPKNSKKSQTPRRTSATPSQAYAGPTFHASPAPSSLPIPKFFSKSVPEAKKAKGLTAMMENESSEGALSPDCSEGSPTCEKAERFQQQIREESPLDIFFKADREERARARQTSSRSPLFDGTQSGQSPRAAGPVSASPSPAPDHVRHHSRDPTCGSTNGLFPIELEDGMSNSPAYQARRPNPPTNLSRTISAPSDIMTKVGRGEIAKRNASSLALKKLLLTPQPQRPISDSPNAPTSEAKKQYTPPTKESSGPFASSPSSAPDVRILSRKQPASLPQLQKQFGSTPASNSSPRPCPPSSNLRQELAASQTPPQSDLSELPAETTPSWNDSPFAPPATPSQQTIVHGTDFSPLRSTALPGVGSAPIQGTNGLSSMENELRRVLKLDILGSDGATGVRS